MFRADPARTGKSQTAHIGRSSVRELWRVSDWNTTTYGAAKGSPSVAGDVIYIGNDTGRLAAFDRKTGDELWHHDIRPTTQGIHGTPALGGDVLYVGAYDGTLYAFELDGTLRWELNRGFQVGSSPVLVPQHGRVYSAHERDENGGGFVVSADARNGEKIWEYRIPGHAHSSIAVDVASAHLFVGDNAAIMHCLDARTGELVWENELPEEADKEADIKTTPVYVAKHDLVVAGTWSEKVYAFDASTGEIAWEFETDQSKVMGSAAYAPERDVIYVGALYPANTLYALDAASGELVWEFETGGSVHGSPAVDAGEELVLVGSGDGFLYAIDAETGVEAWRHLIGGRVNSSPALVGNQVYVAASQGDLVALETE